MVAFLALVPLLVKGGCALCGIGATCYCVKKFHDAYKKGQQTKQKKYGLKEKAVETAVEDNKRTQQELADWKKKYDELDEKIKKRDEEMKKLRKKIKEPNLTDEERKKIQNQLAILSSQQEEDIKERDSIFSKIKGLGERIKQNNKTISTVTSNPDDRHWIWEFLTLENIMVMCAIYALYKMLKDERK